MEPTGESLGQAQENPGQRAQEEFKVEFECDEEAGEFTYDEDVLNKLNEKMIEWAGKKGTLVIEYDYAGYPKIMGVKSIHEARIYYVDEDLESILKRELSNYDEDALPDVKAYVKFNMDECRGCMNVVYGKTRYAKILIRTEYLESDPHNVAYVGGMLEDLFDVLLNHDLDAIDVAKELSDVFARYVYVWSTKGMDLELYDSGGDNPEASFIMLYYG